MAIIFLPVKAMKGESDMIKLYTSDNCSWCRKMKSYLDSKGAEYREFNISNPEYAAEAYEVSGQRAVPITVIGKSIVIGFDTDAVDELLGK